MVAEAPPPIVRPAPQKARLRRWEALPEDRKIARAQRAYRRTWERAAPAYGANPSAPAPEASYLEGPTIDPGAEATTHQYPDRPPSVELSRGEVRRLSMPRGEAKKMARLTLLHKWAHAYQTPAMLEQEADKEIGANLFADYYGKKLYGIPPEGFLRSKAAKSYVAKYGRGAWRRGQFGSNYGVEPNSIRYR